MPEIIKLSETEHILLRPGMYIGSTVLTKSQEFVFVDGKITKKEIEFVPAFIKIFREILDNSIDENIRTKNKYANIIKINIDKQRMKITVEDNGRGLSSEIDGEFDIPKAVLAVTEAMAGSNFSDDTTTIGQNGVGSLGTCVFSKYFDLDTSDGIKRTRLICKNNLQTKDYTQTLCKKKFTKISFIPDFKRLSMNMIDDIHYRLIYKNILDVALSFPDINFFFDGKKIKNEKFSDYVKLYSDNFEIFQYENCDIAVIHNQEIDQTSFINGINTKNGGTHIDFVAGNICNKLRNRLIKKYKTIKPIDVRNNCFFIINIRNFIAPRFDSQLKENLTSPIKDINEHLSDIDFDKISMKISKNDDIIFPIIETFKIKEDLKKKLELQKQEKKTKKTKVIPQLIEANSKNREKCTLYLTEGLSATGTAIKTRDSKYQAFYPISGKFINMYDMELTEIIKKKNISELLSIMGLTLSSEKINNLRYGKIAIMTDEDTDGNAIAALLINFFFKLWPDLITNKKIYKVKSYLILAKHKETKKLKKFYSVEEFENENMDYDLLEYNKGLGSLEPEDYKEAINSLTLITNNDSLAENKLEIAFSEDGDRKSWMMF
jgi:DNA topoisomerase-2